MRTFVLRRLFITIGVVFGTTLLVFFLTRVMPGDPIKTMLASAQVADPALVEEYRHAYGLDQPLPVQYLRWLWNVMHGNLGRSIQSSQQVTAALGRAFQATSILALGGMLTAVLAGIVMGALGAFVAVGRRHPILAQVTGLAPLILTTIPPFSLGLFLIILLAVKVRLFPPVGMYSVRNPGAGDLLWHLVLPTLTMAAASAGATARVARSALLEVLREDYIRTAHAKGLHERMVLFQHALRNALIPVVTNTGIMFGSMLSGAVLVESVFAWPGLGKLMVDAILRRDYPIIEGGTLLIALIYVAANLLVDVSYAFIDPRIRYGR
ncbi:MAG TPA: ABC transporter permease [Anaerolineae bacterium]|nr:ABC transporter permease [Anaerolineae bacterium]HOR01472.1 ABC transporter permease [Anaerolineae bacterium]